MDIIRATKANLDDIVRLNEVVQRIHVEHEPGRFRPFDAIATREHIQGAFNDPAATFLLAIEDGTPLGYAMVRRCECLENAYSCPQTFIELDQIVVAPDSRKRGVGSALVDEAFAMAKSLNISDVELSVWHFNEEAKRFFCKKGFKPCWQRMKFHAT